MTLTGLRITVGLLLAPVYAGAAYWAMPLVFYPAPALGWLYATLVFALGLGVAGLLVGGRDSLVPLGVAGVVSLSLGVVCWHNMEPDLDRVRATAEDIAVPDGWERSGGYGTEAEVFGGGSTHVSSTYRIGTEHHATATADLVGSMEGQGWAVRETFGPPTDRTVVLTSGGWEARITRNSTGPGITLDVKRLS